MEGLSEIGLSNTVVRSDTKCTALLLKDFCFPICLYGWLASIYLLDDKKVFLFFLDPGIMSCSNVR